jgi:hypothetical protein
MRRKIKVTLEFETDQTDLELELMLDNWYERLKRTDEQFKGNVEVVYDPRCPTCKGDLDGLGHQDWCKDGPFGKVE